MNALPERIRALIEAATPGPWAVVGASGEECDPRRRGAWIGRPGHGDDVTAGVPWSPRMHPDAALAEAADRIEQLEAALSAIADDAAPKDGSPLLRVHDGEFRVGTMDQPAPTVSVGVSPVLGPCASIWLHTVAGPDELDLLAERAKAAAAWVRGHIGGAS